MITMMYVSFESVTHWMKQLFLIEKCWHVSFHCVLNWFNDTSHHFSVYFGNFNYIFVGILVIAIYFNISFLFIFGIFICFEFYLFMFFGWFVISCNHKTTKLFGVCV